MSTVQLPAITAGSAEMVTFCEANDIAFDNKTPAHLKSKIAAWAADQPPSEAPPASPATLLSTNGAAQAAAIASTAIPASVLEKQPENVTATEVRIANGQPDAPPAPATVPNGAAADPELSLATVTPTPPPHAPGLGEKVKPVVTSNGMVRKALEAIGTTSIGRANRLIDFVQAREAGKSGTVPLAQIAADLLWFRAQHANESETIKGHLIALERK